MLNRLRIKKGIALFMYTHASLTAQHEQHHTGNNDTQAERCRGKRIQSGRFHFQKVEESKYSQLEIETRVENSLREDSFLYFRVEFFEGWKPLSPLQLAVEEVMSE
ncbi:hypothetical protein Tco_1553579 [Tanacetum coccineum]